MKFELWIWRKDGKILDSKIINPETCRVQARGYYERIASWSYIGMQHFRLLMD